VVKLAALTETPDQEVAPANQLSMMAPLLVGVATTFFAVTVHMLILGMVVTDARRGLMQEGASRLRA